MERLLRRLRGMLAMASRGLRSTLWGALGGAVLPLLTAMPDTVLFNTVPLGAIFAASTVAIARRAALRQPDADDLLRPERESPRLQG